MKIAILFTLSLMIALSSADFLYGTCVLSPVGQSGISGNILIQPQAANAIDFFTYINGLTASTNYGLTIRDTGDIFGANTAGNVFGATANPYDCTATVGSLGNVTSTTSVLTKAGLTLTDSTSIIGKTIVITSAPEQCSTTSASTAVAQCVIGLGNSAFIPTGSGITPPQSGVSNTAAYVAASVTTPQSGICILSPTTGNTVTGTVFFNLETDASITVTAQINDLNTSLAHGIHIHGFGDLTLANGSSVGGHWKTGSQVHNLPPNDTRELGDLGNVCVYDNSIGYYKYNTNYFGNQATSNNFIGRAVVIHAIRDAGYNAVFGARIAQCVIGLGTTTTHQTFPASLTFTNEPVCDPATTTTTTTGTTDATTTGTTTGSSSAIVPAFVLIVSMISFLLL